MAAQKLAENRVIPKPAMTLGEVKDYLKEKYPFLKRSEGWPTDWCAKMKRVVHNDDCARSPRSRGAHGRNGAPRAML